MFSYAGSSLMSSKSAKLCEWLVALRLLSLTEEQEEEDEQEDIDEGETGDGVVVGVGGNRDEVGNIVLGLGVTALNWFWLW